MNERFDETKPDSEHSTTKSPIQPTFGPRGMAPDNAEWAKEALVELGYLSAGELECADAWNEAAQEAMRAFQLAHDLPASGCAKDDVGTLRRVAAMARSVQRAP